MNIVCMYRLKLYMLQTVFIFACFYFVICQVVSINVILEFYLYSHLYVEEQLFFFFLAVRTERLDYYYFFLYENVISFCYIVFVSDGKIC